ncbi:hypothetical protein GALMADRAFT_160319 [Galerina marginata CBS 339.88]|uniref:Uncharacterized protein n=1 Tax=Galerina marginata (strain CBS 339.88) TaxID=685588 RepID=A0A067SG22_GALM3|nr:hypothetical protein GALMADRAFT_160319 [Galerina marginata CBS 339.88]
MATISNASPSERTYKSPISTPKTLSYDTTCSEEDLKPADPESDSIEAVCQLAKLAIEESLDPTGNSRPDDPPILTIPFEIAAEIFIFYTNVNSTPLDYPARLKSTKSPPFLLAAVCKTWREIALSTPRLWTTVNIFISSIANVPLLTELALDCMSRSGQLPLTVSITAPATVTKLDRSIRQRVLALFDVIGRFSSRWYRLVLCIRPDLYEDFTDALGCMPLLEDLRLTPVVAQERSCVSDFCLLEAPRLKHLELSRLFLHKVQIPVHNLTSLEVHAVYINEMLELLKSAPHLIVVKFSLIFDVVEDSYPLPAGPLTHYSLRHLDIRPQRSIFNVDLPVFLHKIVLPSLESFVYHSRRDTPVDGFISLFARSRCLITTFEILIPEEAEPIHGSTEGDLVRLLEGIPTITHLTISLLARLKQKHITDYFFGRFADTPTFLPQLEVLNFAGTRQFNWSSVANALTNEKGRVINISVYPPTFSESSTLSPQHGLSGLMSLATKNPRTTLTIVDYYSGKDIFNQDTTNASAMLPEIDVSNLMNLVAKNPWATLNIADDHT